MLKIVTCIFILLFVSTTGRSQSQEEITPDVFRNVAKDLRCPTCTGLSILDSDAKFSVQIKDEVKKQLEEGKSKEAILAFFVERYGPWILREPPKKGFGLLAWVVPISLLALGPIILWFLVWRRRIQVETFGARPQKDIIEEMNSRLAQLRKTKV